MSKTPITLNFVNLAGTSFSKSKPRNGNVKIKQKYEITIKVKRIRIPYALGVSIYK